MAQRRRLHEALAGRRLTRLEYEHELPKLQDRLLDAQFELRQQKQRAVVMIVTGIPAAGRSEVVNELLGWLDPKLVTVYGFKDPNDVECERPALWRFWRLMPPKGRIAILHGGWYQDVLHDAARRDGDKRSIAGHLKRPVERIRQLEAMLVQNGVRVVKVHLHVGPDTQQKRLAKFHRSKLTRWRVSPEEHWMARHYGDVERAYEHTLDATDQPTAPWHVIDGTDAQHRALEVGRRLLEGIESSSPPAGKAAKGKQARKSKSVGNRSARGPVVTDAHVTHVTDEEYDQQLERLQGRLALLSRRKRFARHAVVAAFEGMDASGKGGAIRRITAALDARQFRDVPISAPTPEELARPYLWRFWFQVPPRGNYTIFDRTWYGRVLVERVRGFAAAPDWQRAYDEINEFERQLVEHRIIVAKFWLAVSKQEQLERFRERDRNPLKRFKVDPEDWENRKHWDEYQRAARDMIDRTDTPHAPWTVVAADDKRHARLTVLRALADRIEAELD
jgi:AMP-polyphosphate phosphotransferase